MVERGVRGQKEGVRRVNWPDFLFDHICILLSDHYNHNNPMEQNIFNYDVCILYISIYFSTIF